jgi:ATP:corrinoid adenosyltransferase
VLASLNLLKILCSIFEQSTLGQFLDRICEAVRSLHEKRPNKDNTTANSAAGPKTAAANFFNNAPPITKSQRIKTFVKSILKKLMKKFSYEILLDKMFAFENSRPEMMDMIETVKGKNVILTGSIRQGLENLLANLKKLIDKEKAKKQEDQQTSKKENKKLDLVSIYTTNSKRATNALGGNE